MTVMPTIASRIGPPGDAELTGGSGPKEEGGIIFEALLKGFHKGLNLKDEGFSKIRPWIGQSAESFLEAALPATTAIALGSMGEKVQNALRHGHDAVSSIRQFPTGDEAAHLLTRVADMLRHWATAPVDAPLLLSDANGMHAMQPSMQQAVAALPGAPPGPTIRQSSLPEQAKGLVASLHPPGRPNAAPSTSSANSPFAAHLLDLDGQLRLVVKLPKLLEDQRMELEARLRELLDEFGHHSPELVIRETGSAAHG